MAEFLFYHVLMPNPQDDFPLDWSKYAMLVKILIDGNTLVYTPKTALLGSKQRQSKQTLDFLYFVRLFQYNAKEVL